MSVHVKGLVLRSRVDYICEHFGADGWRQVLAEIAPENRSILSDEILISSWYPLSLLIDLPVTADRIYGKGDLALCRAIGRESARLALQGVHRSFVREGDPGFVIRRTNLLWNQYFDSGTNDTERIGPSSVRICYRDFEEPHRAICLGVMGWLESANTIWGGKDVLVSETTCRCWGDNLCEFLVSWSDARQWQGPRSFPPSGSAAGGRGDS